MKALVTGATGLIGSHVARVLVDAGHEVRCLVRPTSDRSALDGVRVSWVKADLASSDLDLGAACMGCDLVFHTAALFTYSGLGAKLLHDTAVGGTEALLRACANQHVPTVVVTSSSVVFGYSDNGINLTEAPTIAPANTEPPYVAVKIAQHKRSLTLGQSLKLDVRFACPTMTIGPTGARLGPSNGMVASYLTDPFHCTFPGGCNVVAARDVAIGHVLIAQHGHAAESYLLGGENLTWRQFHSVIAELAGVAPPSIELSHSAAYLAATAEEIRAAASGRQALATRQQAAMIGRYYWYEHNKAAALGYSPKPARDAVIETISWLAASPHISREVRARMRLSPDIYRFRFRETETSR